MKRSLKRILISPLDWGLGHATRCIPIIKELQIEGAEVIIAGEGRSAELLKQEFPNLEFLHLPGYEISYPEKGGMALHMMLSAPGILRGIRNEHKTLQKIIRERKIDLVISDNRYGLWSHEVPCIFITHQVFIQAPFAAGLLHRQTAKYMSRFSECWIPDLEGEDNLAGCLAHTKPLPDHCFFIGPLSRFRFQERKPVSKYDLVISLSGPEPQRSVFEKEVLAQIAGMPRKILLLQGITNKPFRKEEGNRTIVSHLCAGDMMEVLSGTSLLICRSGYSSIMDAAVLGKKCIFIPTPGQTEQEYLASYHAEKGHCIALEQKSFDLNEAVVKAEFIRGFEGKQFSDIVLKERLMKWLEI